MEAQVGEISGSPSELLTAVPSRCRYTRSCKKIMKSPYFDSATKSRRKSRYTHS